MADDDSDRTGRDPAPAVTRSIRLLEMLADSGRPMTLTELASALGLAKSSTANLCLALEAARMVERVAQGFRLGIRTAELGGAFAEQFNQVREFYAVCDASEVLRGELVQVALLDGADALYIARHEGSTRIGTPLGSRLPAALSATGRALLSTLDDAQVTSLLGEGATFPPLTEHTTRTLPGLLELLAQARDRGWAVDAEESFRGVVGVAVPLEGWAPGDPQLALGVGIPAAEATPERIRTVGAALLDAAKSLTNPFSSKY
ncbi:IclR family transcriptional regulator [Microbacterium dauci]|uniref:IclR family transcriptional regulator n=1 Tax=Microbacterium dauci TaxID=3048008 RepID=A0ABT6ZB28_9MICO|nr:IclR family transcriptional regulator [Microbacterium sp. LX3-4]MDJ1113360.1 IclR family transcriptional regulator [Microbacterium sp. LX3-4]